MNEEQILRELTNTISKYENKTFLTGETNIYLMASSCKDFIEEKIKENAKLKDENDELKEQNIALSTTMDAMLRDINKLINQRSKIINYINANHFGKTSRKINEISKKYNLGGE